MSAGQEFRCKGILAITKAPLEGGIGYVGGYPRAPVERALRRRRENGIVLQGSMYNGVIHVLQRRGDTLAAGAARSAAADVSGGRVTAPEIARLATLAVGG